MAEGMSTSPADPTVFTIPAQCAFADSLARGLIARFGSDPMALARGRILLPSNRAVRTVTEAFVRESGGGLLLPRLIPIGDPELDERVGGALDASVGEEILPAIDPEERLLWLASMLSRGGSGAAESMRLAADLARTLDALLIEDVDPSRLADAVAEKPDLALHWQISLEKLQLIYREWPGILRDLGVTDLAQRRNLILHSLAKRWRHAPPTGFTIAAGITTAAPAIASLLEVVARMEGSEVVIPGLWLDDIFPQSEWDALRPAEGRGEPGHPQYQLKLLLDRMRIDRGSVRQWPVAAGACSSKARARSVANAMASPAASAKWISLKPAERDFTGIATAEFPDVAAEAQGIALALREAVETPGRTAALVTPDRALAIRVSALLKRWGIDADDSAGRPLSLTPPASLILSCVEFAAENAAPVPLLSVLKHPLIGGEGEERRKWLDLVRALDASLRGPRPAAGIEGLTHHFAKTRLSDDWHGISTLLAPLAALFEETQTLATLARDLSAILTTLAGDRVWSGADGRKVAELLSAWQDLPSAATLSVGPDDAVPLLRQLFDAQSVRPPYGGHPRIFIWGLLEARLQRADLMVLGGLNEGTWPALPSPDPWLPPSIRSQLGMPSVDSRIGLSAQDFAGALGAPDVLVTRAKRDSRSPTVKSRFWLRLTTLDPDRVGDKRLPELAFALDRPAQVVPADRPAPSPAKKFRPTKISVTAVDRLRADPYAFYAEKILRLKAWEPVDADATAAWKGTAVHDALDKWCREDDCAPGKIEQRIEEMLADDAVHPLLRAFWRPRLMSAVEWIEATVEQDRLQGRTPAFSERKGEAQISGVLLHGKVDRIDVLPGDGAAIVDYKTGRAPDKKAIAAGYALQLGLLGLIARANGFGPLAVNPRQFEYWSLGKDPDGDGFGYVRDAANAVEDGDLITLTREKFAEAAARWLTGSEGFKAKLNPAYSQYGNYDQLMRLEEWYARAD